MPESEKEIKIVIEHLRVRNMSAKHIEMAIKALEKQIPKKMDRYYCPICRHYFEDGESHNYCPECGQKIDWE